MLKDLSSHRKVLLRSRSSRTSYKRPLFIKRLHLALWRVFSLSFWVKNPTRDSFAICSTILDRWNLWGTLFCLPVREMVAQRVWIWVTLGSESQEFKNKNHQATSSLTLSAPGAPYQSDPALGLQFSNNLGCEMKEFHCTVYVFVTVLLISIKLAFELAQSMFIFKQKGFFGGFFCTLQIK